MQTAGMQMWSSEKIKSHLKDMVSEVQTHNKSLCEVRGPKPELVDGAKQMLEAVGAARGRPLYYPYLGSGLGNGAYVELIDGSVKLDLINGIGIHILGHSHPQVMEATLRGSLNDIIMQGNLQPNREYFEFTNKLVGLAGKKSRLKHAWLATCGTMANENAFKIARQKNSPAKFVVAFKDAFAGRSTAMAEITDNPAYKVGLPEYNEVLRLPFCSPKEGPACHEKVLTMLKEHYAKHEKNIAAFVFEPVQGEGGFKVGTREFLLPILEFCKQKSIAVWADEVQTFMRTGELFAFETLEIGQFIDICTIAKTAQVGATIYTEEYNPKPGLIAGTFSGSSASLAAGSEILQILTTQNYLGKTGRIQQIHNKFVSLLNELNETSCKGLVQDAGGLGLMVAFTPYDGDKNKVEALLKRLFNNGLIAFGAGKDPYRARFLVPAIIKDEDLLVAQKIIEKSILEGLS